MSETDLKTKVEIGKAQQYIKDNLKIETKLIGIGGQAFAFLTKNNEVLKYYKDSNLKRSELVEKQNFYVCDIDLLKLDHPNIAKYYEIYEDYGILRMEYCGNENFKQRILMNTLDDLLWMFSDIINATKYLNDKNFVTADLKPENISLFEKEFKPKLIDVDSSVNIYKQKKIKQSLITTVYSDPYIPKYSKKSDVFKLAVILYQIYVQHPFFQEYEIKNIDEFIAVIKQQQKVLEEIVKNPKHKHIMKVNDVEAINLISSSVKKINNRITITEFKKKFGQIVYGRILDVSLPIHDEEFSSTQLNKIKFSEIDNENTIVLQLGDPEDLSKYEDPADIPLPGEEIEDRDYTEIMLDLKKIEDQNDIKTKLLLDPEEIEIIKREEEIMKKSKKTTKILKNNILISEDNKTETWTGEIDQLTLRDLEQLLAEEPLDTSITEIIDSSTYETIAEEIYIPTIYETGKIITKTDIEIPEVVEMEEDSQTNTEEDKEKKKWNGF